MNGDRETRYYATRKYRCLVYPQKLSEDLFLTICGMEDCLPGYRFDTGGRTGWHLHVILSGKGTICVEGREQELHFGQMFVTKPGEETWYRADGEQPWSYCWMTFDGNLARRCAENAGFVQGVNSLDCFVETQKMSALVQKILDRPELGFGNDMFRMGMLAEYLSLAVESRYAAGRNTRRTEEYPTDVYVQYALEFMNNNYAEAKVSDVARYIGIHRSYLTSIFKKKVGISPQEYLMQRRMREGRRLLLETSLPVQDVARRIGYEDPLTFSKIFKNTYGMSPRACRLAGGDPDGGENEHTV
ncbi:MAG: helix-turn-helix domain-containing protein [Lachnospiraceae bacterium]|nr:helix-turn-helix domain-containing protein [Lachnospiraceae bacterium]